jgi:hypothetical protein
MTQLLTKAVSQVEQMPPEIQDNIAALILAELEDQQQWQGAFSRTTDAQWDRMADLARADIDSGRTEPLDEWLK